MWIVSNRFKEYLILPPFRIFLCLSTPSLSNCQWVSLESPTHLYGMCLIIVIIIIIIYICYYYR